MKSLITIKEYTQFCLEQGFFCDVLFDCEDGLLGAHKIVLIEACPYLKNLINGSNQDQITIILPGISSKCLHLYLRILYGEMITVAKDVEAQFGGIDQVLGLNHLDWCLHGVLKTELSIERTFQSKLVVEAVTVIDDKIKKENNEDLLESSGMILESLELKKKSIVEMIRILKTASDDESSSDDDSIGLRLSSSSSDDKDLKASVEEEDSHSDNRFKKLDAQEDDSMGEIDEQKWEDHSKVNDTLNILNKDDCYSCSVEGDTVIDKPPTKLSVNPYPLPNAVEITSQISSITPTLDPANTSPVRLCCKSWPYDDSLIDNIDNTIDEQKVLDKMVHDLNVTEEDDSLTDDDSMKKLNGEINGKVAAEETKKETAHAMIPDTQEPLKITNPLSQLVNHDLACTSMLKTQTHVHAKNSTDQLIATGDSDMTKGSQKVQKRKYTKTKYKGFGETVKKTKYQGFGEKLKINKISGIDEKFIPKVKRLETKKTCNIAEVFLEAASTKYDKIKVIPEDEVIPEVFPRLDLISQVVDGGDQETVDNESHMIDFEEQMTMDEDCNFSFDMNALK